jgi:Holliday junction resolvasome RuvABC endonuclease subunit
MTKNAKPILALDPGLRGLGLAVLSPTGRLRHAEVLTAPWQLPLRKRLARLSRQVDERLALYRPRLVVVEATWPSRNGSFGRLHLVTTLLQRRIRARGIRLLTVPAGTARRHLTGSGWTGKREAAQVIAARFPELRIYLRQDRAWKERHFLNLFDAVALGVHSLRR